MTQGAEGSPGSDVWALERNKSLFRVQTASLHENEMLHVTKSQNGSEIAEKHCLLGYLSTKFTLT